MKIVVLCGGLSTERKISFSSGTMICGALRRKGHQAVLVDLFMGLEDMDEQIIAHPEQLFENLPPLKEVVFDGQSPDLDAVRASRRWKSPSLFGPGVLDICSRADLVFIGLHGLNGEDGRVQAAFDLMGIPYTGSGYLGAGMAMDKMITKKMLRGSGIKMADWKEYYNVTEDKIPKIMEQTDLPCVVKTPTGGSSVGVYIVREQSQLRPALEGVIRFSPDFLIEDYIEGTEYTDAVLGDRALPSVEIVPKTSFYDYSNKYQKGATDEICPGRCSREVEEQMHKDALTVHRTLGLRTYSRSDFIVDKNNNVYFLEVNTLPGMTPTSLVPQEAAAVGMSFDDLCQYIVDDAMTHFGRK